MPDKKLSVAIHKLTSCSGCQLAFLNQGTKLLDLLELVDIKHFIEGGLFQPDAEVDVAFVEGSVATNEDLERLKEVREKSALLVSIGACATTGGIQALRNMADKEVWKQAVYPHPEFVIELLDSTGIAEHVQVDFELWGCPVSTDQIAHFVKQAALGVLPIDDAEKLCMQCKRSGQVCVLVSKGEPCLGPVVRTGCGALCPEFGRACYGCFGPSEQPNCHSLANRFAGFGLVPEAIAHRFASIHSHSPAYKEQHQYWDAISVKEVE